MADTQNPGGWPDAARPGVPEKPERDGWHWLETGRGKALACYWHEQHWTTPVGDFALRPELVLDWRYLGPCLTPAEVAAREAAARREGIEACLAEARAEIQGLTTEGEEDAVGNVIDRIRALLEDGR